MIWLFGIIIGLSGAIEGFSVTWSGLYLLDVYGLDPSVTGALFVSVFYLLFTLSRFISGFIIEKVGYIRSVLLSGFTIIVLFATAFGLGRTGIYLLPVTGFFIAVMWPTVLAIAAGFFRERAQTASSAIICIAFSLSGIVHYGVGLTNSFLGAAWGYRSCILYSIILAALLLLLRRRTMSGEKKA
jgi:fucose permease